MSTDGRTVVSKAGTSRSQGCDSALRRAMTRLWALCALVVAGLAHAAPPASFSPLQAPVSCTEPVLPERLEAKSTIGPVRILGASGLVYVADFAGNYNRGELAPRAELAAQLIGTTGQDVDFVVVFTDFEFATGEALAFYNTVRNDVRGIGQDLFDHSSLFGSPGRLQGYVDMAAISRYSLNTRDPGYRTPLTVLSHELMHRWGIGIRYLAANDQVSADLLGRDGSHWSLLADTDASVMYGGRWQQEADGGFRLVESRARLSRWDLYLAGFAGEDEVPAMRLLRNTGLDPAELPVVGMQAQGVAEQITLQQVIAAEGARQPSAVNAQRQFTAALVMLVRPGQVVDDAKLAQLQRFARRYESYFQSITEGRASLRFIDQRPGTARTGTPEPLGGSQPLTQQDPVAAALAWLKARQQQDGGFADRPGTAIRDTASALRTILQIEPTWPAADSARGFLSGRSPNNQDDRLRLAAAQAVSESDELVGSLVAGWADSPYDLSLSAALDADASLFDGDTRQTLLAQLLSQQVTGGGFSSVTQGAARLRASLLAVRALLAFWPEGHAGAEDARAWLLNHLLELPLQGARSAGTSELADALVVAGELRLPESLRLRLRAALEARQGAEGDWEGSIHTTATAALALARLTQPDLEIVSISVLPASPLLGEPVVLRARVRNGGGVATPEIAYRWLHERSDAPGTFEPLLARTLPALIPGESAVIDAQVETQDWPAISRLQLQLDPDDVLVELSEDNNRAEMSLQLAVPGTSVDLALVAGEHAFSPPRFQRLGDTVTLNGQVRNLGGGPALRTLLRLERIQSGTRHPLAETHLDLPENSRVAYTLEFAIEAVGDHALELTIDPLQESDDPRRGNNVLNLHLPVEVGVDLAPLPGSLELRPGVARVGSDLSIRIGSINLGSRHSGEVDIELRRIDAGLGAVLQRRPLRVEAGDTATTEFLWRPVEEGSHRLQVVIDPDGHIDEFDEDNNTFEFDVEVVRSEGVDLLVVPGSTRAIPAQPLQGRPLQVSAQLVNQGAFASGPYAVALYLGDPRSGGQRIAAVPGPDLAPGGGAAITLEVEAFPGRGDVSLFLMVDSELAIPELDEDNNLGIVDAIARAMADLGTSAQAVVLQPEVPMPGMQVTLRAAVSNRGEQPSEAARVHLFEIREGEPYPVPDAVDIPPLDPGASFEAQWQWVIHAEGAEALRLQIDPEQVAADGDRSNNEVHLPIAADIEGGLALTPFFSPNGDGVRDRAMVVVPSMSPSLARVDVRDVADSVVARIEAFDALPNQHSLVVWDGVDLRGEIAPDGEYILVAVDEAERTLANVRVVLDTDRPMALASVQSGDVATRRLPSSVNEWLVPPSGSSAEDYLYTWGSHTNTAIALKRGIARTHAYLGGVEPVLSARWLERHAGNADVDSLLIEPSLGRELVFNANGQLWVQDVETLDQPRLLATLPTGQEPLRLVGSAGSRRVLLEDGHGVVLWADLDSGVVQALPTDGNERVMRGYASGVLVGRDAVIDGGLVPSRFLPFDAAHASVDLGLGHWNDSDCFGRVQFAGEEPALYWHALRVQGESVLWIDLRTGASREIFNRPPGGCPGGTSSPGMPKSSIAAGFAQARLQWLEHLGQALLVDHAHGRISLHSAQGLTLSEYSIPAPLRAGGYGVLQDNSAAQIRRGEPVGYTPLCPARLSSDWSRLARWGQGGRSTFDPLARELYFATGEILLDGDPDDTGNELGGGYGFVCEGAVDYFALSLSTGALRRVAGQAAWPLLSSEDRARYPLVAAGGGQTRLPMAWPRFLQHAGAHLREDGRIAVLGAVGRTWARAVQLFASVHAESRLLLTESHAEEVPHPNHVVTSLQRLRADLRASSNGRSVTFTGFATDANLDYFQIDYARIEAPEDWLTLLPPTREQVRGDEFLTWAPPQAGAYLFRLRVIDRAGNRRDSHASAELVFSSPITNARVDHRAISPNGDGVKDALQLDFMVARPTELGFRVIDEAGRMVFSDARTYGMADLGEQRWIWNGQGEQGGAVPDGLYRVELTAGFAFPVAVDTVFPTIASAALTPAYPPGRAVAQVSGVIDRRGSVDISLEVDRYLEYRPIAGATWQRHASGYVEWFGGAPLQWLELFGPEYRWVAEDKAGNRVQRVLAPVEPALALVGVLQGSLPDPGSWQQRPFAATRMSDVPMRRNAGLEFPSLVPPHSNVPVYFWSGPDAPAAVQLEIVRTEGQAHPDSAPLSWRALQTQVPEALGGGRYKIFADFSDLAVSEQIALRIRESFPGGSRVSNGMRFVTPPTTELVCTPELPGMTLKVALPNSAIRARLRARSLLPMAQEVVVEGEVASPFNGQEMSWAFPGPSSYPGSHIEVDLWFPGLEDPWNPRLLIRGCSSPGAEPGSVVRLTVGPQNAGCGAPVASSVRAWPRLSPSIRDFRLELVVPGESVPRLIASGNSEQLSSTGYAIDTSNLPGMEVQLYLHGMDRSGTWLMAEEAFPIDRSAPLTSFVAPVSGARVCAIDGGLDGVDAFVATDTQALYALEVASLSSPEPRYTTLVCNSANTVRGCETLDEQAPQAAIPLSQRSFSRRILSLPDARVPEGAVSFRLRALDWSGAQSCSVTNVHVDASVEVDARREPLPDSIGSLPPVISPAGEPESRTARWFFRSREAVQLRAEIFAVTVQGSTANPRYQITGPALASLREEAQPMGDFDIEWDARLQGQNAPDGVYGMRLHVRDECGHTRDLDYFVRVDATPPELEFTSPVENAELRLASVQTIGTVRDDDPGSWELAFSASGAQGPWQQLSEGRGNVPMPAALGVLQTQGLLGPVWLRLSARDRVGNASELVRRVNLLPRPDVLASARLSRTLISPNGDGRLDALELRLVLARDALLDVELLTAGGQVLERLTQSQPVVAGPFGVSWGGQIDPTFAPDGGYRLRVRAIDAQLGGEPDEAELDFVVDRLPPELVWSPSMPAVLGCETPPELSVADSSLAEYRAELRDASGIVLRELSGVAEGSYGFGAFAQLVEGTYRLEATALDEAGNRSEARAEFTLDCSPPELAIVSPEVGSVLARAEGTQHRLQGRVVDVHPRAFRLDLVSSIDPEDRRALLDGAGQNPTEFDVEWSAQVPDGGYLLELTAQDQAGNSAVLNVPVDVDGTPPVAVIHWPDEGEVVTSEFSFNVTATDAHFAALELLTATPAEAARGEWTRLLQSDQPVEASGLPSLQGLPQGERLFRLDVHDRAGLSARAERRLLVDAEPPPAPIELVATLESGRNVRLAWRGGEAPDLAGFHVYRITGNHVDRITSDPAPARQHIDVDVPEGLWAYQVTAIDQVGNESAPSNRVQLRLDHTPPEALIAQPGEGERVRGTLVVRGTAASLDDFDRYELVALDAGGSPLHVLRESSAPVRAGVLGQWDTRETAEGTVVRIRLRAWDRSGNLAEVARAVEVDNLPPAAPQGLGGELQGADLELHWLPNAEPDLLGYLLYRNGRLLTAGATLPADLRPLALSQNSYVDPSVPDGDHVYRVYAIDTAGNLSAPSAPFTPQVEQGPPSAELLRPDEGTVFDQPIEVLAHTEHRDVAEIAFSVRGEGQSGWTPLGDPVRSPPWRQVFDPTGQPFGDYELRAVATDHGGLSDPQPPIVRVRHDDITPPPAPEGLSARADGDEVRIVWSASSAPDLSHHHLERFDADSGWTEIEALPTSVLSASDPGRPLGTHRYRVLASDLSGNRSEPSDEAEAEVFAIDLHPLPHTPSAEPLVSVRGSSPQGGHVQLWREVGGDLVELPGAAVSTDGSLSADAALLPGRNLLRAAVTDARSNRSLQAAVQVTHGAPPSAPQGVQGTVEDDRIVLRWTLLTDAAGYRVYRNGRPVVGDQPLTRPLDALANGRPVPEVLDDDHGTVWTEQPGTLSDQLSRRLELRWAEPVLVGGLELSWRDAAHSARDFDVYGWYDERWNRLAEVRNQSGDSHRLVLDTAYPTQALMFAPVRSQWPGRPHALAEVRVLARDLVQVGEWSERVADGRHRYTVTALSPLGFESPQSTDWVAEVGDAEAPPAVVLSGAREGRDALLSWTASDASDLARYRLMRGAQLVAEVAIGDERRFRDVNLPNGMHRYVVLAEDAAGNVSLPSNEVVIEIGGDVPGVPTITQARSQLNAPALELHWQAGTGAVPVRFRLFASTLADDPADPYREIARPLASPWLHDGLSYGMRLYYRIQAEDAAGNVSALSPPFEAQVRDLRTPTAPAITWPALAPAQLAWTQPRYRICGMAEAGRGIEVRVNGDTRAEALARLAIDVQSAVGVGTSTVIDMALSPDGSRLAWLEGSGSVRERDLQSGETRTLPSWLAGALRYGASGHELQGLYGDEQRWSVRSDQTGEYVLDFGLDRVERAVRVGLHDAWMAAGELDGQGGLWWIESEHSAPRRVAALQGEAVLDLVVDARTSRVYALTDSARVLRWDVGTESAHPVVVDGDVLGLRAHPLEPAVLAWSGATDGSRVWRIEADEVRLVLEVPEHADDTAPAADGTGVWLLAQQALLRYEWNGDAPEEIVALDESRPFARLLSSPTGTLVAAALQTMPAIQVVRTAGAWCTPELGAVPGRNSIVAVARNEAGVRSSPSPQLDLDVDAVLAELADLSIDAAGIGLLPSPGIAGQPHSLLLDVRNLGYGYAWDFDVQIAVTDPQGITTAHLRRASLGPDERTLVSLPLGLVQSGEYRIEVQLDAESRIDELSEANNRAQARLQIHPSAEPRLDLSANLSEQPPGRAFEGRVTVAVAHAFSGRVELWIADAAGAQVARLPDIDAAQLTPLAPWSRAWTWLPQHGVLAGGYRLHARLRDTQGAVRAEQALDLNLQARVEFALSLQPAAVELPVGQSLGITVGLDVAAANALVEGGQLQLQIERADGSTATIWSSSTGILSAGYRLRRTLNWATTNENAGEVQLRLVFTAPGLAREVARTLYLLPSPNLPSLFGELALAPAPAVALGQPAQLVYRVGNRGTAGLNAQTIRVQVLGESDSQALVADQRTLDLSAGEALGFELDLSALPQRPAQYAAVLEAETAQGWRRLAQLGLQSTDVEPPVGELLVPLSGQPVRTPAYFEAAIRDRHSRVDFAEYSLNGGTWRALPGAGDRYSSVLGALPDGEHQLALRAQDIWGNRWQMPPRTLVVDNTPPWIDIQGVVEGEHYPAPVQPVFTAQDPHLAELRGWDNGLPVESGAPITTEGVHRLEVHAVDAAGNRAQRELSFVLDFTPPTLGFVVPVHGAQIAAPETAVELQTEPGAGVELSIGAWQATAIADAQGRVLLPVVPLQSGLNRIDAQASDRAGNRSAVLSIEVTRVQQGGELVGQLSLPAATHARGEPLQAQLALNNQTAEPLEGEAVLRVQSASGALLAERRQPVQLQAGEQQSWAEVFATADWPLGALGFQLLFDDETNEVVLANAGLDLVDRAPPQLRLLQPSNGDLLVSPLTLQVEASDDDALADVSYRVGQGAWTPLTASTPPLFTASLPLADGVHALEARAVDRSGNVSTTPPISVVIDSTPPEIVIEGVADEGLYGEPVRPQVRMVDAHPDTLVVTLNDQAFVPGSLLDSSGRYRLHVQATDRLGQTSERQIEFELDLEPVTLQLLSPEEGAILPTDRVDLLGLTKPHAQVTAEGPLSSHQVQADALGSFRIDGVGLNSGTNTLTLRAVDALGRPSADLLRTVRVDTSGQQGLFGLLQSAAEIAVDQPWTLQAELRETLGQPRDGLEARVLVERTGQPPHELAWTAALPANGQQSHELVPPVQTALGLVQLRLQVRLDGVWVELAQRSLAVVDRTPPELAYLAPAADSYHRGDIELRAQATDMHGEVAAVQARIEGGEWIKLKPTSGSTWQGRLHPIDEGRVSLELRAQDAAQNWTPIQRRSVIHDRTPPQLDVTGIADGGLYRERVQIHVSASDASPVDLQLQLNGAPFASGQWVDAHGRHTLVAQAVDAAGNASTRALSFEIDLLPPEVVIVSPAPAAVIRSEETQVLGHTEAASELLLRVHDVERSLRADAQGQFRFDRVPLRIGANRLQVRATDAAGNIGPWAEVSVERRGGFVLRGHLQAPAELNAGAALPLTVQVSNDAAHPQPEVRLRLLARDASGSERLLDTRTHGFAAGEVVEYRLDASTTGWAVGTVTLRLLATDDVEVQLADARVQLRGQTGVPPPSSKPRPIPIDQPLVLALLVLVVLAMARTALRRREERA